ncbi:aminotransferase class I/II-fold pyridoxal phosphate-dependent enzyme [Allochromatium tepidum]|uniref:Aminotransferase class I/classII large domain-containing protein n=1 Tax=Allochromatium tepidum TaxID=553982 RepID=A0ABM7QK73_9GAMM|nr:aminotransferase class I/II-fold pyridoxal phosphate-dependent enzyme [Allochromatium tepidum]BCU06135.1 hypothetical protein Atep_08120 [Allochromatium tepidum]
MAERAIEGRPMVEHPTSRLAERAHRVEPFHVMRLLGRARELEAAGRSIVHLEVGEPDFPTPEPIPAAGRAALDAGLTHYTPAAGLPALRQAIAAHYAQRHGVEVDPARVLVTPGASGALQPVFSVLLEPGDRVILGDPSYPCYRQMFGLMGAEPVAVPLGPETGYRLTPERLEAAWVPGTRAVVASPANPTGAVTSLDELCAIQAICRARGAALIVDEIYRGLTYGVPDTTALALAGEDLYVEEAGVALTPDQDFGAHECNRHVRLAYTRDFEVLDEGVRRIGDFLAGLGSTT